MRAATLVQRGSTDAEWKSSLVIKDCSWSSCSRPLTSTEKFGGDRDGGCVTEADDADSQKCEFTNAPQMSNFEALDFLNQSSQKVGFCGFTLLSKWSQGRSAALLSSSSRTSLGIHGTLGQLIRHQIHRRRRAMDELPHLAE
ncbi:hypothetical protein EDB85DRAFT_1892896 [Lactarius pseudohatsudake]|nr:hypothetical protein EDB85DRAFT_1892896 [Lactarius pseudohatsudake]